MLADRSDPTGDVAALWRDLGIEPAELAARGLIRHEETTTLVPAETAPNGQVHQLAPAAAAAWKIMKAAALDTGVDIHILSGFRSFARQAEIIRSRLDAGMDIVGVLTILAPPGCSEHHTGRAVDISTKGIKALQLEFETTPAFDWLLQNAGAFGFTLSYPRDNAAGYGYEPWHWCFRASGCRQSAGSGSRAG